MFRSKRERAHATAPPAPPQPTRLTMKACGPGKATPNGRARDQGDLRRSTPRTQREPQRRICSASPNGDCSLSTPFAASRSRRSPMSLRTAMASCVARACFGLLFVPSGWICTTASRKCSRIKRRFWCFAARLGFPDVLSALLLHIAAMHRQSSQRFMETLGLNHCLVGTSFHPPVPYECGSRAACRNMAPVPRMRLGGRVDRDPAQVGLQRLAVVLSLCGCLGHCDLVVHLSADAEGTTGVPLRMHRRRRRRFAPLSGAPPPTTSKYTAHSKRNLFCGAQRKIAKFSSDTLPPGGPWRGLVV